MSVTKEIYEINNEIIEREGLNSSQEVNNGFCLELAEKLNDIFIGGEVLYIDKFLNEDNSWIIKNNKKTCLDYGCEGLILLNDIDTGHNWFYYEGLHYDAESPEGVEDFLELNFFKRQI